MITKLRVEKYKGFKEAEIPIKPITLFLGANSSGKSSILQLILLLQQTAEEASDSYKSPLKIIGNRINIGRIENLFYKLDSKNSIVIQMDFFNDKVTKSFDSALNLFIIQLAVFYFNNKVYSELLLSRDDFRNGLLAELEKSNDKKLSQLTPDYIDFVSNQDVVNKDVETLMRNYDMLTALKAISNQALSLSFTISYYRKKLIVSAFSLKYGASAILSYSENDGFSSDLVEMDDKDRDFLSNCFSRNKPIFDLFNDKYPQIESSSVGKSLAHLTKEALFELKKEFKEPYINHVSPLRAHPQRYYMLDNANIAYSLDTFDANAIAEVIKDKPSLKETVNRWLEQFGLKVDVDVFKESIHKLTVCQSGLQLDIPDVGFGVSQVLPVVLQGFLSPNKSLTIIEQPEVHLHPQMQGALADLFIDIVKESKFSKHLVVETHSEYLLRRLRRRMAEGNKITPNNVSINLFHTITEDAPARVETLSIAERGAFEWPEDFYGKELYNDIVEFLKLQNNGAVYVDK